MGNGAMEEFCLEKMGKCSADLAPSVHEGAEGGGVHLGCKFRRENNNLTAFCPPTLQSRVIQEQRGHAHVRLLDGWTGGTEEVGIQLATIPGPELLADGEHKHILAVAQENVRPAQLAPIDHLSQPSPAAQS